MNSLKYCLDTHPLIWYFTGQKTLSAKAKLILDEIFSEKVVCSIPSIVLLEALHISYKVKGFIFPTFLQKLRLSNIIIVPLDKIVLETCFSLPKDLDIHDRIILATSMINGSILVTRDPELLKIRSVKTLW